ncbi:uncharacterized protein LOC135495239 [Lineus longissimus]|uniref:uncharacterized protein LOC135495239 n=1 Tax=Lineus longissimus TaxID=88925 RepID=UPI002B4EF0C1
MSLGKSLRRSLATVVTVALILFLVQYVDGQKGTSMQVSCSENGAYLGKQVGDVISVYSDGYPDYETAIPQPGCKITLESCLRCRFRVEIRADFPVCNTGPHTTSKSICSQQWCRTLLIYDTVYRDTEAVRVSGGQAAFPSIFLTTSNFITLDYCKYLLSGNVKFNITVYTVEKETLYHSDDGLIVSPNFPFGYYARKEIYTYMIESPGSKNHAVLKFIDWELNHNADSKLRVESFNNGFSTFDKTFYAKDFRPMLFLTGNQVNLTFSAGSTQGSLSGGDKYYGFKIQYEFTSAMRVDLPKTDCGEYLSMSKAYGGEIKLYRNRLSDYIDCVWVIPRPPSFTNLMVRMESYSFSPSYMSLTMTIYGGMTSNGMPLVVDEPLSIIDTRRTTSDGLFIRLQGKVDWVDVKMAYLSYVTLTMGHCIAPTVLCTDFGSVCVSDTLSSTEWDKRCGITSRPTATDFSCWGRLCNDGKTCYSWCDGVAQCPDKADEENCPADSNQGEGSFNVQIIVPVIVLFLGVPIIVIPIFLIVKHCVKRRVDQRVRRRRNLLRQYANNRDRENHDNPAFRLGDDGVFRRPGTSRFIDDHVTPTMRGIPPPSYHTLVSPLDEREQYFLQDRPPSYRAVLSHPSNYRLSVVETKPVDMEPPPAYESVFHIQTQLFSETQRLSADADGTSGGRSPSAANPGANQQNRETNDDRPTLLQRLSRWTMMPRLSGSGADDAGNGTVSNGQVQSQNPLESARGVHGDLPRNQGNAPFTISRGSFSDSRAHLPQNDASRSVSLRSCPDGLRPNNSEGRISPGQEQSNLVGHRDLHQPESNHSRHVEAYGQPSPQPTRLLRCNSSDHKGASASSLLSSSHGRSASLDSSNSPGMVRSQHLRLPLPWIRQDSARGNVHNDAGHVPENDPVSRVKHQENPDRERNTNDRAVPAPYRPSRSISYRTPSADEVLSVPARRAGSEFSVASRPVHHGNSRDLSGGLSRYRNRPLHSSLSNLSRSSDSEDTREGSVSNNGNSLSQGQPQQLTLNLSNRGRQHLLPSLLHESVCDTNLQSCEAEGTMPVTAARKRVTAPRIGSSNGHQASNTRQVRPPVAPRPGACLPRSHIPGSGDSQSTESKPGQRLMDATKPEEFGEPCPDSGQNTIQERGSASEDGVPLAFVESSQGAVDVGSDIGSSASYV